MRYLTFVPQDQASYEICFLVPQLHKGDIQRLYIDPHFAGRESSILAYDLHKGPKKTPVVEQREYLAELLPILSGLSVKYLVVCDAEYFKTLTKAASTETALGYVLDCALPGFETMKVVYCPNFRQVFYDPDKVNRQISIALKAVGNDLAGEYTDPGDGIIKFAAYPQTVDTIHTWLQRLLDMDCDLTADIEAFSLKHDTAGIGTISFAWNKHEGIAFPVDLHPECVEIRALLKEFFIAFKRKMRWHNISYDVYVLVYQLFMKDLLDTAGLLEGLSVMLRNWDCTKLITYLATNSCAGNKLGLKFQAQEFAGNYAVDEINDIRKIPLDQLLRYNLADTLSTWFVFEKHWPTVVADDQVEIYETLFKPGILDIIQMQLTGLPLDMERVRLVNETIQAMSEDAKARMQGYDLVREFVYEQTVAAWKKDFDDRRKKAKNPEKIKRKEFSDFKEKPFNPNSPDQLQSLLYGDRWLALPVLDLTDTKQPATGGDTLEKLLHQTQDAKILDFLKALIEFKALDKVLTAFLPTFLEAPQGPDGWHYLFGYFNLGGTVSGRLSSSNPNLQNLPANVTVAVSKALLERYSDLLGPFVSKGKLKLGSLIKFCFRAPPGKLFIGLDFASLEDRISALTTKDPNKLKVYTDGYDGHCLRAYSYFGERMPDIDPTSVDSINKIADLYPKERGDSKAPTFALTYQGTYLTLIANCGFTEDLAKRIEERYHELYRVSDEWVAARIQEAGRVGYLKVAFGLRVRTPLLRQVILGTSKTPYEAAAEGRTAGNALGQSWCLLNTRAASEFMGIVRSGEYRLNIRPCAHIHDAQYYVIDDDMEILLYVNEHLVRAVNWQDHPDIYHPEVGLGGELDVFYPDWSQGLTIPNGATAAEVKDLAYAHLFPPAK